jgi:hypothetical protein
VLNTGVECGRVEEMKAILAWWWHKRMARAIAVRLALYRGD